MSRVLVISPDAQADIAEAAIWYEDRETGLAAEFLSDIDSSLKGAIDRPLLYRCLRKRPNVRRVLAKRFPYRILYIVRRDALVVFAVLHTSRHDRHWRRRVQQI